jgi:hypothetical protein
MHVTEAFLAQKHTDGRRCMHLLVDLVGSLGGVRGGVDDDPPLATLGTVGAQAKLQGLGFRV